MEVMCSVDVEVAVVDGAAVNSVGEAGKIFGDGDDAAAIFDQVFVVEGRVVVGLEVQFF